MGLANLKTGQDIIVKRLTKFTPLKRKMLISVKLAVLIQTLYIVSLWRKA